MNKFLSKKATDYYAMGLFAVLFIAFVILSYLSDGSYIGGDTYVRYMLSKYAFHNPENLLYNWGKPIYIAIATPFAQFGYNGFKLFNVISGFSTALLAYSICRKLKFDNSWLVVLFVCFSPIFYMLMFTGMTEIFFGFIIMLSIYFIVKDKYILSAIVLSFLPIIRNEGVAIWILFIFLYSIRKRYKAIPFLLTGFLFYSICGWFYYHDFWWLITQSPYKPGGVSIYGHGVWNFYFINLRLTLGIPLTVLFVAGILAVVYEVFIKNKFKTLIKNNDLQIIVLVLAVFLSYFTMHSILWWKGWMSVLGDARFMAAVTPFGAIIGLKGFNTLLYYLRKYKIVVFTISILISILLIRTAQFFYAMPVHLQSTDLVVRDATLWIKNQHLDTNRIYYYDPFLPVVLDVNPFDHVRVVSFVQNYDKPQDGLKKGELIVWDSHFSPNEGNMPLSILKDNTKDFTLLNVFKPKYTFKVLGDHDYEIYIFQRN